jgi:hypothetical protein
MSANDSLPQKSGNVNDGQVPGNRPPKPPSAHVDDQAAARIPAELRALPRWVVWRWVWKPDKNKGRGGWDKPPVAPDTGTPTDATNEAAWLTFDEAREASRRLGDGIGFALGKDSPYCGVDFDKVIDDRGQVAGWARAIVDRLASYTEGTPSGHGLRVWVKGRLPRDGKGKSRHRTARHPGIEFYDSDRYFTVTGRCRPGTPATIEDRAAELAELHAEIFTARNEGRSTPRKDNDTAGESESDDAILDRARSARNGAAFEALFRGDTSAYDGDDSAADLALCAHLAFWFQGDGAAIDRLFRRSGLYREKWERADYRDRTIAKALEGRTEFYDPSPQSRRNGTVAPETTLAGEAANVANLRARAAAFETWTAVLEDRDFLARLAALAAADRTAASLINNDLREGTLKKVYKARDIKAALKQFRPGPRQPAEAAPAPAIVRASIEDTHERHIVRAQALAVLPKINDLFVRGRVLVRIARHETDEAKVGRTTLRNAKGLVHVVPLGKAGLSCQLTQVAEFFRWREDADGEPVAIPVHPPAWLPEALLEHEEYPGVRDLRGVAECPFPRPDGTIVTAPGYDPATGVFLAPAFALDPLPEAPDRERARAAARDLFTLVGQFPFAGETKEAKADNFAAWLAGLLAVMARPAIEGEVPGLAFNGNKAGTGKGRLIDLIGVIATGRRVAAANYPEDKAEFVKFKVSLALAAIQAIHIDNLEEGTAYGGDVIDSALTSSNPGDRILGMNKTPEGIELRTCWFLSGNNVSPRKDAYRRWLVCNLKSDLEHPEERDDLEQEKILAYALEHRAELARAALIILQAHAAAGRPKGPWPGRLGSFEEWDEVVRGAVWYATGRDCYATQRKGGDKSPDRQKKIALLRGWYALPHQAQGLTARTACNLARDHKDGMLAILWNALLEHGRNNEPVTHVALGKILATLEDSVFEVDDDKLRFERHGEEHGIILWRVAKVTQQPTKTTQTTHCGGGSGDSGDDPGTPCEKPIYFSSDSCKCEPGGGRKKIGFQVERLGSSPLSPLSPLTVVGGSAPEPPAGQMSEDVTRRTPTCERCGQVIFGAECVRCSARKGVAR